jgi:hypothetical protein
MRLAQEQHTVARVHWTMTFRFAPRAGCKAGSDVAPSPRGRKVGGKVLRDDSLIRGELELSSSISCYVSSFFQQLTALQVTAFAALLSALAALIAAGAARRSALASVRSASRQAWINALRDDVAELLSKRIEASKRIGLDRANNVVDSSHPELPEIMDRVRLLMFRINLRLDPDEEMHQRLTKALLEAPAPPLNIQLNAEITAAAQAIIRREWKKAANGK